MHSRSTTSIVRNCRDLQLMDCCFSMDWNDWSNSKRLCLFCGLQNYEKDKWNNYLCGAVRNSIVNIWTTVLGMGTGSEGQNSGDGVGMGRGTMGTDGDGDQFLSPCSSLVSVQSVQNCEIVACCKQYNMLPSGGYKKGRVAIVRTNDPFSIYFSLISLTDQMSISMNINWYSPYIR